MYLESHWLIQVHEDPRDHKYIFKKRSTFLNGIVFGTILLEKAWRKNINCFKIITFLIIHILIVTCSFHALS